MCHNWGYLRLAEHSKSEAMEELGHAQSLMERILFLAGQPNMRELADLRIGRDVKSQFENDLALEAQTVPDLNESIAIATDEGDNTSRELFEKILIDEEEHVDWLEAQLGTENAPAAGGSLCDTECRTEFVLPNWGANSGNWCAHWDLSR